MGNAAATVEVGVVATRPGEEGLMCFRAGAARSDGVTVPGRFPLPEPVEAHLRVEREENDSVQVLLQRVTPADHRAGQDPGVSRKEQRLHQVEPFLLSALLHERRDRRYPEVVVRVGVRNRPERGKRSPERRRPAPAGSDHMQTTHAQHDPTMPSPRPGHRASHGPEDAPPRRMRIAQRARQ